MLGRHAYFWTAEGTSIAKDPYTVQNRKVSVTQRSKVSRCLWFPQTTRGSWVTRIRAWKRKLTEHWQALSTAKKALWTGSNRSSSNQCPCRCHERLSSSLSHEGAARRWRATAALSAAKSWTQGFARLSNARGAILVVTTPYMSLACKQLVRGPLI